MQDIEIANLLIRLSIGTVMFIFGLSQVKSPEKWLKYMPGIIRFLMPIKPTSFMKVHALGNLSLGILLASGLFQPISIWVAIVWWAWVSPFAFYYEFTVGLRDLAIIMAIVSLLFLQT